MNLSLTAFAHNRWSIVSHRLQNLNLLVSFPTKLFQSVMDSLLLSIYNPLQQGRKMVMEYHLVEHQFLL